MKRSILLSALALAAMTTSLVMPTSYVSAGVNHQTSLRSGESKSIAAQLVSVKGYTYVDVAKGELQAFLKVFKPVLGTNVQAVSFHSVVAKDKSQNTAGTRGGTRETGFLQLVEVFPNSAPTVGQESAFLRILAFPSGKPGSSHERPALTISGQKVLVYEDAGRPDSRFTYMWYRHGVAGYFDGATRPATEKWLRAYLSLKVLDPGESSVLSQRLTPIRGFAYANMVWDPEVQRVLRAPLGAVPYSTHAIVNSKGVIGALLLAQAPPTTTLSAYVAKLKSGAFKGYATSSTKAAGPLVWFFLSVKDGEGAMVTIQKSIVVVLVFDPTDAAASKSASDFYVSFL